MSISLSGPILENWLLSGKAIHKNFSIGGAGLTQLRVPEGKTFIITNIEMLPFANIINQDNTFADGNTFVKPELQDLSKILKRLQFQLLFYTNKTNSVYNIRNKFLVNSILNRTDLNVTVPSISFEKHSFDCFHVVEDNCWFFLKYFDFDAPPAITTDNYPISFDGSQSWAPTPQYGYSDQYDITGINPPLAPAGFNYFPQGVYPNFTPPGSTDQFIMNSIEQTVSPQTSAFVPPYPDQALNNLTPLELPSIPFYNISVIEINRRLSTFGLL